MAQQVLPSKRGGIREEIIMERPSGTKSPTVVSESKAFGMIKLLRCSEKSYVLRKGEDGHWPQLVEVRKDVCDAHQIAARMLYELSIDDATTTKSSLLAMRDGCMERAMVEHTKILAKQDKAKEKLGNKDDEIKKGEMKPEKKDDEIKKGEMKPEKKGDEIKKGEMKPEKKCAEIKKG